MEKTQVGVKATYKEVILDRSEKTASLKSGRGRNNCFFLLALQPHSWTQSVRGLPRTWIELRGNIPAFAPRRQSLSWDMGENRFLFTKRV